MAQSLIQNLAQFKHADLHVTYTIQVLWWLQQLFQVSQFEGILRYFGSYMLISGHKQPYLTALTELVKRCKIKIILKPILKWRWPKINVHVHWNTCNQAF